MKTNNSQAVQKTPLSGFLRGIIPALIFTAAVFLLCAVLLTYTEFNESIIPPVSLAVTFISSFFAGAKTASGANRAGILWGILSGAAYIAIILLLVSLPQKESVFSAFRISGIAVALIAGACGGILGINTKK
ncbi:TIGR04086 family membrane protein [Lachnospiraceae bacterium NSJ-143]|nr:TIGR04086 family membrane protein [Lachnospiraceae bacterium NSJ-143]